MSIRRVCPIVIDFSTSKSMTRRAANHPLNQKARLLVVSSVLCLTLANSALHMYVPTNRLTNKPRMCLFKHMLFLHTTLAHTHKSISLLMNAQLSCESHRSTICVVFHQTSCMCMTREHSLHIAITTLSYKPNRVPKGKVVTIVFKLKLLI